MQLIKVGCTVLLGLLLTQAQAATVVELKPEELAGFVKQHPLVVLQLTSPDKGCGFCVGADQVFDQAANLSKDKSQVFARIQWSPWRNMPDFSPLIVVFGIPTHFVLKDGVKLGEISGKQPDGAAQLIARLNDIFNKGQPASAVAAVQTEASALDVKPSVLSEADRELMKLQIRNSIFKSLSQSCGKQFPEQSQHFKSIHATWEKERDTSLQQAMQLVVFRTSHDFGIEMSRMLEAEVTTLKEWQVQKLGIPMQKPPTTADCENC
jgi:hypothetical protein